MPLEPRELDIPKIPGALRFYIVMSFITGTFLLLLVAEMILRYGFGVDLEIAGPFGFLHLTPHEQVTAVNGSTAVLIIHGWLYVFYLIACFRLWAFMRWSFLTLIVLALGGVIPALSFFLEAIYAKKVRAWIASHQSAFAVKG
jgi:integral membrane protein